MTDAQLLCNMFSESVDIVDVQNVIHLITDNGSNLILHDISKMPHVVDLAQHGSQVTKFFIITNGHWVG